ncbi:hypothetical protein H740_07951 [Campylobacter showae CC57C]|uniref:Uncharacterized protein n=1 Tax=Campylobacter showae CC57C TaxID=1073353 RepID=M3JBW1_9BACT|nr:hypothetical protein H740_07951 [Campylobacter showae CC57C]
MRVKDSELSGHLAFAPYSALNFTHRDGNVEFENGDSTVKFTKFDAKCKCARRREFIIFRTRRLERKFKRFAH